MYTFTGDEVVSTELVPRLNENFKDLNEGSTALTAHIENKNNPHGVTAEQLGLASAYMYAGSVDTYAQLLAITNARRGDVYDVKTEDKAHEIAAGTNFAWNGTAWDNLGGKLSGTIKTVAGVAPDENGNVPNIARTDIPNTFASGQSFKNLDSDTGGRISLQKAPNSSLEGNAVFDIYGNFLRIYQDQGNYKGMGIDLNVLKDGASSIPVFSVNGLSADYNGGIDLTPLDFATNTEIGKWKSGETVQAGQMRYLNGRENCGKLVVYLSNGVTGSSQPSGDAEEPDNSLNNKIDALEKSLATLNNMQDFYLPAPMVATRSQVAIPRGMRVKIANKFYESSGDSVSLPANLDGTNNAAQNIYIYACVPNSGNSPTIVLSKNSTVPSGYTADNSRKIGGFHCLCVNVGNIGNHKLNGYLAGDIIPNSLWNLRHRPRCYPDGMVYVDLVDWWFDIYLASWDGSKLVNVFNGVVADGASAKKFHGELYVEELAKLNKVLPDRDRIAIAGLGSNQATAISGAKDWDTTGGHVDTANRRMISDYGLEDCAGFMWQWTSNLGFAGGSGWTDSTYNSAVDSEVKGKAYGNMFRLLTGGDWANGSDCGSRAVDCDAVSASVASSGCGRGSCEPLKNF